MIKVNGRTVEFETFPNGETKMVEDSINLNSNNQVHFKFEDDSDLMKLLFVNNYLISFIGVKSNSLIIYYMPYSRMDRSESGSAFTLRYVADFINSMSFGIIEIIEPHSDVTPALVRNSTVNMINYQLLPKVIEEVQFDTETDYLIFPDAGAQKRYNLEGFNSLVGNKKRDFETGRITSFDLIGEVETEGHKAIIVDDLSSYGGTFILTAQALLDRGFYKTYLLVAHAEENIYEGDLLKKSAIDKVFTTNSILDFPSSHDFKKITLGEKVKIYDIEELLSE
jgi:ribose-phosphate pyrophosphokinase